MKRLKLFLSVAIAFVLTAPVSAQTAKMNDRALWASIAKDPSSKETISTGTEYKKHLGKVLVSWRMLPQDDATTGFDLYRRIGTADEEQLNRKFSMTTFQMETDPIYATNYQDTKLTEFTKDVTYRLTLTGSSETLSEFTIKAEQLSKGLPYISIPLKTTEDCCDSRYVNNLKYEANDCAVGDLDGDGQFEIVVKRMLAVFLSNGTKVGDTEGACETDTRARHIVVWDAYKLDGTFMWRVMSGPNIIAGNSSNFAVADLDGDGQAEMITKTGEGTVFGDGKEIGDTDGDGITDYRQIWPTKEYTGDGPRGYGGPEFFSVIDGKTGRELARADFIARGIEGQTPEELAANWEQNDWKWDPRTDKYAWKLANSLRLGVAEFTGRGMQVFLGRGVYGRTVVEGWQYDPTPQGDFEGTLTRLWKVDTNDAGGEDVNKDGKPFSAYAGQGNHAFNVADLDGDGLDEVMYGSCAWDNDGSGLWSTGLGHGDASHVGKFLPERDGLQVFHCLENGKTQIALHDAKTGETIWQKVGTEDNDMGRCMVADVDPTSKGCEFWMYGNELISQNGTELYNSDGGRRKESSANAGIWFDGTLSRQLINENTINSYTMGRTFTMHRFGVSFNNSSKSNPGWYGDMTGDWREEVIVPTNDKLTELRVFATWYPTDHRFPWLMTDHHYYMQAIHYQVGYNQPTNLSYYLGSDLKSDADAWAAAAKVEADRQAARQSYVDAVSTPKARLLDDAWYNLMGQKVDLPTKGGVYIHQGRKVLVK